MAVPCTIQSEMYVLVAPTQATYDVLNFGVSFTFILIYNCIHIQNFIWSKYKKVVRPDSLLSTAKFKEYVPWCCSELKWPVQQ